MKKLLSVIMVFTVLAVQAQTKQDRTVGDFDAISGASGIEIEITKGTANAVSVSASDEKFLPYLKTVVEKGELKIYFDNYDNKFNKGINKKLKAFVTYKSVDRISVSSGANMKTMNAVSGDKLTMQFTSGAMFSGEINVSQLTAESNSGAIVKIKGTATNAKLEGSSGSVFSSSDLMSEKCIASVSSGAIIRIGVSKLLTADAESGGVISYKGEPEVKRSQSSGGRVRKI